MSDSAFPSMTALLGLLAVAGFQNRDKIAEMLGGLGQGAPNPPGGSVSGGALRAPPTGTPSGGLGGVLGQFAGKDAGSFLGGGLNDLIERFTQAGHGQTAQSWVAPGQNHPVAPRQLEEAIGGDTLATLSQQTGLSREEVLARLSRDLPAAVDQYTPDGRLPPRR